MMAKRQLVVKSNKVVEASYRLTLSEQRLILLCIAQIKKGQVVNRLDRFEVSANEFAKVFNVSIDQAYRDLQQVAERLYERSVTIANPDPDDPRIAYTKTRWISSIDYLPNYGSVVLHFAHRMIPYISMLEGSFTMYRLESISQMGSAYSIRLYELLMQWREVGTREIALKELRNILQLEGRYSAIKDFKVRVLEPALRDINEHSDLEASYTQRKAGRVVSHLIFHFKPKPNAVPMVNPKPKAKRITKAQIEKAARPGESYEDVKARLEEQLSLGL